jgi:prepilin-type N-terminal cleavage/methylation domain-containing protein
MSKQMSRTRKTKSNVGFSMVEMLVALTVISIAMIGGLAMIALGIGHNGSMRMDTTAANVAQTFLEDIASVQPKADPVLNITDCAGNNLAINTGGPGAPGAPVYTPADALPPGVNVGDINFTAAVVPGYQATYRMCAPGGIRIRYDVRWNIQTAGFVDATGKTWGKLVTVAALQSATVGKGGITYSQPVTLRTVVGM